MSQQLSRATELNSGRSFRKKATRRVFVFASMTRKILTAFSSQILQILHQRYPRVSPGVFPHLSLNLAFLQGIAIKFQERGKPGKPLRWVELLTQMRAPFSYVASSNLGFLSWLGDHYSNFRSQSSPETLFVTLDVLAVWILLIKVRLSLPTKGPRHPQLSSKERRWLGTVGNHV